MNFHDPILCKNYDTVYSTSQPDIIFIKKNHHRIGISPKKRIDFLF